MNLHKSLKEHSDKFTASFASSAEAESFIQFTGEMVATFQKNEKSNFNFCQFDDVVHVVSIGTGNHVFQNCVFKNKVHLEKITREISFSNCFFEDEVISNPQEPARLTSFRECELESLVARGAKSDFEISSSVIKSIHSLKTSTRNLKLITVRVISEIQVDTLETLEASKTCNLSKIRCESLGNVSISDSVLSAMDLNRSKNATFNLVQAESISIKYSERIFINHSDIDSIKISNCKFDSLRVTHCNSGDFFIDELFCTSSTAFVINHLLISGRFEINHSNLGIAEFEFLLVRSANVIFRNSNYDDWKFGKVDWPTGYEIDLGYTGILSKNLVHRDFYRELKRKCIENENMIDAAYFKSKEIAFHSKYISELSNEFRRVHGLFKYLQNDLFSEWFILWTNKIFSGFGGNVWRPLLLGLFLHLIFFNLFLLSFTDFDIRPFYYGLPEVEIEPTIKGVVKYLEMFNPLHSFDDNVKLGIGGLFMDIVMRVSSGYFIFYILRASRKFAK